MNAKANKLKFNTPSRAARQGEAWDKHWHIDKAHDSKAECFIFMTLKIIGFIPVFPPILFAAIGSIAPSSGNSAFTSPALSKIRLTVSMKPNAFFWPKRKTFNEY